MTEQPWLPEMLQREAEKYDPPPGVIILDPYEAPPIQRWRLMETDDD